MQKTTKSKTKMQKRLLDLDSYGWKKENVKNDQRLKLKNGAIKAMAKTKNPNFFGFF
jgi:hypothetical protein